MKTKNITVNQAIEISFDETKFTPEFMAHYQKHFRPFADIDEHISSIAELFSRGVINGESDFLEGYGILSEFGIRIDRKDIWSEED